MEHDLDFASSTNPFRYEDLQPHQKKFYDVVRTILDIGITPTPRVVNEALGKDKRTTWNGPLCRIRAALLIEYGYELVEHSRGFRTNSVWRWEKKK